MKIFKRKLINLLVVLSLLTTTSVCVLPVQAAESGMARIKSANVAVCNLDGTNKCDYGSVTESVPAIQMYNEQKMEVRNL